MLFSRNYCSVLCLNRCYWACPAARSTVHGRLAHDCTVTEAQDYKNSAPLRLSDTRIESAFCGTNRWDQTNQMHLLDLSGYRLVGFTSLRGPNRKLRDRDPARWSARMRQRMCQLCSQCRTSDQDQMEGARDVPILPSFFSWSRCFIYELSAALGPLYLHTSRVVRAWFAFVTNLFSPPADWQVIKQEQTVATEGFVGLLWPSLSRCPQTPRRTESWEEPRSTLPSSVMSPPSFSRPFLDFKQRLYRAITGLDSGLAPPNFSKRSKIRTIRRCVRV